VTPIALTRAQAAQALSISMDSFERYVQPEVKTIRRGRLVLVPVRELERWVEQNSELLWPDCGRTAGF